MWLNLLSVALGGAIGASARYCVSLLIAPQPGSVPLATLTVNVVGSFLIGILAALFTAQNLPVTLRLFLIVGILGGFTTFSTFALDTASFFDTGEWKTALINILANNAGAILFAFIGMGVGKYLFK